MNGDIPPNAPEQPGQWQFKPGDSIQPQEPVGSQPPILPNPVPAASPNPPAALQTPEAPQALHETAEQPHFNPAPSPPAERYAHQPTATEAYPAATTGAGDAVTWSASEYIAHQKTAGWYAALAGAAVVVAALVYVFSHDKVSTSAIIVVAIVFGIYAARKPRVLQYRVDGSGLTIGHKFYSYNQFRSFAVMGETAISNIAFMPLKRFMPLITVYFDPKDEEKIVDLLADRLPMEKFQNDPVDRIMHRIRF